MTLGSRSHSVEELDTIAIATGADFLSVDISNRVCSVFALMNLLALMLDDLSRLSRTLVRTDARLHSKSSSYIACRISESWLNRSDKFGMT
jgi:predicted metal-dependent hydrolase